MADGANRGEGTSGSDFDINVTDPVKMGDAMNGFVTYRISIRTRLPQYKHAEFYVIRRFSDFNLFHARLLNKNPGVICPPLPDKSVVEKFRFSPEYIEKRRVGLKEYLDEVTAHPILKYSVDLQLFLEASEEEWKIEKGKGTGARAGKKFVRDISQGAAFVVGKEIRDDDPTYQSTRQYFTSLEQTMEEIHKQVERFVSRHREQASCLSDFGKALQAMGEYEGSELARKFTCFNKFANKVSTLNAAKTQLVADKVERPLKKMLKSLECVKSAMDDREYAFQEYRSLCADVESKISKKSKLSAQGGQDQRVSQLELDISETERKKEAAKDNLDFIIERLNSELTRYQAQRSVEMSAILSNFSELHVEISEETSTDWTALLPELDNPVTAAM